ncbi:MAG: UDP-2,4-diacetamido-2,4,6-trideoxy-beta-L-altropyranose hydrolase [Rhodocyclaceae bacterium]|nr:UDP-2,4-diacetamido-2,4,6-trideoxy-beta-L-altropyranose hydrolase [Rhodocyclaceae bacterium]
MNIAFRTDASLHIGTGHVMRCLTLADVLKQRGAKVRFVCRHLPDHLRDMLIERDHQVVMLNSSRNDVSVDDLAHSHWLGVSQTQDARDTSKALSDQKWDLLVVDHYALDVRWETASRDAAKKLLVIDDIADRQHDCDVLLDQNLYADMDTRYVDKVPAHCQLLLGPRYALLRDEFRRSREKISPRNAPIKRVLVFFGGVDHDDYTSRAVDAIARIGDSDMHVDVVIGTQHPRREEIEAACALHEFDCHIQTNRMADLMLAADLAIGAGGSTTWERCCLGLPTIVFAVAENQERASKALANTGAAYFGRAEILEAEINNAMTHLFTPPFLRQMSIKAAELVDGHGADYLSSVFFQEGFQ